MAEAKKWLSGKDLAEFKWDVNKYIKYGRENALNQQWMKELENASARFHVSRLEALKLQTQSTVERLFGNQTETVGGLLKHTYLDRYYHTAYEIQKGTGVGWDIAGLDERRLKTVLSKPWTVDGKTFSDRIWAQKEKLIDELHTQLTQNMILGRSPGESINEIAAKFSVSKANASRLVMTESAWASAVANRDALEELDVEKYEILVALDERTCPVCGAYDGKVFELKEFEPGLTAHPFHPRCRCDEVPYFADGKGERAARGEDGKTYYVPQDMKYEDWKEKFVDGGDKTDIMILEQSEGGFGVPEEYAGKYDDFQPLSFSERDREVLEGLYEKSQKDGFEHGAAMIDGKVYEFTSDLKDKVAIPDDAKKLIDAAPEKSVHLYHSHTNATPHSKTDIQRLLHENVDKVSVIAYNKDAYSVYIGDGWMPGIKEFNEITEKIRIEVLTDITEMPGFNNWTIQERYYARVREQAYRIVQHFKWTMEGGSLL